jgi:hypothetical protein
MIGWERGWRIRRDDTHCLTCTPLATWRGFAAIEE